ncbi:MAG: helix-turn-helix domain-containing protein [Planctomycetales bacterium]|nr:helix-turn-helix domain-containing protein [Planctomycetales bacterium]
MNDQLLTVDQAAERLQVSVKTVRNLIKSGQLAHYRIGAGRGVIRISVDALEQHLADCEVRAGDAPPARRRQEHRNLRHIKL